MPAPRLPATPTTITHRKYPVSLAALQARTAELGLTRPEVGVMFRKAGGSSPLLSRIWAGTGHHLLEHDFAVLAAVLQIDPLLLVHPPERRASRVVFVHHGRPWSEERKLKRREQNQQKKLKQGSVSEGTKNSASVKAFAASEAKNKPPQRRRSVSNTVAL
jgi:hypothetical protein